MTMHAIRRTLPKVLLAAATALGLGCGPSAAVQDHPPGHLEYDLQGLKVYRDGARVEYFPVPEEIDGGRRPEAFYESLAKCFFLNDAGVRTIEDTIASLDPRAEYPPRDCPDAPFDAYTEDYLYIEGFEHSPFLCPSYACFCHPALTPIPGVYNTAVFNLDGIVPTDEDGNELWYLDETRTCEPGEWRSPGG